jgi:hypothetical protein
MRHSDFAREDVGALATFDGDDAVAMSAGNGSPSAQTAPSSKYSFVQIGTVFF